jgi:acyl transferase domain-containing protein/acyl carrier protein
VEVFVEVGPHPVLNALAKATLSDQRNLLWSGSLQRGMGAWERLLTSVGQLYAKGVRIDWRAFDRGRGHRSVTLPTYPFQRQRHWLEDTDVRRRAASASVHPLLGARMDCAAMAACFERTLTRGDPAFLADHRIGGQVIMPLTAYLEMALAAGRIALRSDELVVRNLFLGAPLILAGEAERLMQVTVDHADDAETNRVRVFSRLASADGEAWTLHASADVTINSDASAQVPGLRVEAPDSAREVVDAAMLYSRLRSLGVDFGPSFLGLKTAARTSDGATTGRIETPAVLRSKMSEFCCHPAVLDACLHVAALALDDSARDDERIYLPVAVDRFTLLHSFPSTLLSDARVRETDNGSATLRLDVNIRSEAGELIARLEGVSCRLVNRDVFAGSVASLGDRLMYEIAWRELDMPSAVPSAAPGAWIVLADSQGTCEALTNELAVRGDSVWRVVPGNSFRAVRDGSVQINPQRSEDYARLLSEVAARADLKGIIDLWGLRVPALSGARAPSDIQTFGAAAALYLLQACARQATKAPLQLFIVTHGSQATRAAERVRPEQAPLWGLGKVALVEHAELRTTLIDLDGSAAPTRDVASMLAVILGATDEPQVAVRDGRCLRPRLVPLSERSADSTPRTVVCRQRALYLVTGAFGALGILTARWLFDQGARHLILAGRRPPDAAALTAIRALQAGGAQVSTVEADVATAAGVDGLMAAVAKGDFPLKGIVHCAGVLADGLIAQQSTEQLTTVMRPKADAAWHLHVRTQALDTRLDFFVLFSSFSAIMGAAGQANYVAANSFLDALAADRATQGLPALSVGWGSWEGSGMAARAQVVERFAALGIRPLRADEAFTSLAALLHQRVPHAAVAPVDWTLLGTRMQGARGARLLEALLRSVDVRASGITGGPAPQTLSTLARLDRPARIAHVQGILHDAVRAVLGLRRADGVLTDDQTFASLGLDSLTAVELRNALHARLGVRLEQNVGFQYPTLGSLVGHLDQLLQAASVQASNEAASDVGEREEVTL